MSEILFTATITGVECLAYTNNVFHIIYPEFIQLELNTILKINKLIEDKQLPPQAIVAEFPSFIDVSKDVREYLSDQEIKKNSICHAGFLKSKSLIFLANAYKTFNKPVTPTKFFYKREAAFEWATKKQEEFYQPKAQQSKIDPHSPLAMSEFREFLTNQMR